MLFDHVISLPLHEEVIETMFVQGIAQGTLRSSYYLDYTIQDIVYLANAARAYDDAAQMMQEQGNNDFALFYWKQAQKFDVYNKDALSNLRLKNADNVKTGTAIEMYMALSQGFGQNQSKIPSNSHVALLHALSLGCSSIHWYS